MATKKNEVISVPKFELKEIVVRVVGDSPLVVHQFGEKARRIMLEAQMKKASKGREVKNPVEDFMRSLYWLTPMPDTFTEEAFDQAVADGARFGFPAIGLKASAVSGAYRAGLAKNKTVPQGAFHIIGGELLEIKGAPPRMREDMVRLSGIGAVADIRHRAEFENWYIDIPIQYNTAMISPEQILAYFQAGGFSVGIGEFRPEKGGMWGRYRLATEADIV